jgi:hypothetical protein
MQMHVIATELGDDWAGPYTNEVLLQKTLSIIQEVDSEAEIISRETDPFKEQIMAGMRPYKVEVDLIDDQPQLPAEVSLTWPPAAEEGIQEGTKEHIRYFVWAKSERDATIKLASINKNR